MVTIETFRKLALSFPDAFESPHFHKTSFRANKKIFSTLDQNKNLAVLKLSLIDQSVFCDMNKKAFYPVHGAWGKQGFTYADLKRVKLIVLKDALNCAYKTIALKKKKL